MRTFSVLLVALLMTVQAFAQNDYQLFRADVQYLYQHQLPANAVTSPLLGIRLGNSPCYTTYESVLPNFPDDMLDCALRVPAFAGSEICQEAGLTRLNLQSDEDPLWLELYPQAAVGTQWFAAFVSDSIFAEVTRVEQTDFLGLTDSVKSIEFYNRNEQGNLEALYDLPPLRISKNYGLVSAVFLHWLGTDIGSIELVGMSQPEVGIQNPERANVFNLSIGDEFHWYTISTQVFPEGGFEHTYTQEQATLIDQYWTTGNEDRVYVYSKDMKIYYDGPASSTDTIYQSAVLDTVIINWERHAFLDEQAGSLLFEENSVVMLGHPGLCDLPAKQLGTPLTLFNEECIRPVIDLQAGNYFYEGLGGPYFANLSIGGYSYKVLQYANLQNNASCGTPFDFVVSTKDQLRRIPLRAWPNPTQDFLSFEGPWESDYLDYEVVNEHGKIVKSARHWPFAAPINVADLPAGIYWISITGHEQKIGSVVPFVKQ